MKVRHISIAWLRCLLLMGTLLGIVIEQEARSAEWYVEPSLTVRGEVNSNLALTTLEHDPTYGHWVSPGAKFGGSTEALEVSGRLAADFVRYYGGQNTSITNLYFPVSTKYKTEKDIFGFDGGFIRDNTLMGELRQTGVVLRFTQRNQWTLSPSWTHNITEKLSAMGTYTFYDTRYENGLRLGLADYTMHVGSIGLSYQLSERDQVQVNAVAVRFAASDLRLSSTIVGPQITYAHMFSETLSGSVSGGPRHVSSTIDTPVGSLSDGVWVWTFSGNLEKRWDDWRIKGEVGREINPSGFGLLLRTDKLSLDVSHQITERLTASVTGLFLIADGVKTKAVSTVFPENRLVYVTPKISWRLSEWWTADMTYSYALRDVPSQSLTALGNSATIMFTYYPPRLTVGR